MGHGHQDHHDGGNDHNIQENDEDLSRKIRSIDLIKYNPNLFHVWIYNPQSIYQILGGGKFLATAATGGALGYWYFQQRLRSQPATFYAKIFLTTTRVFVGLLAGSTVGYLKFGDRQRLNNGWVAERLRRRYPEALDLETTNLWRFKGVKPTHEFYRWT